MASEETRMGWRLKAKRAIDVSVAVSVLMIMSPVMAMIAIGIKLGSPGPVLFRQTRIGYRGVPFEIIKFRSMVTDTNRRELVTSLDDPRVTGLGRIIRLTSLDELPQLINVLKGDMSLVGPRPLLPGTIQPDEVRRSDMRPGMTSLVIVSGRQNVDWDSRIALDLQYVDSWSLMLDLRILLRTIGVVLSREGVYDADGEMKARPAAPVGDG